MRVVALVPQKSKRGEFVDMVEYEVERLYGPAGHEWKQADGPPRYFYCDDRNRIEVYPPPGRGTEIKVIAMSKQERGVEFKLKNPPRVRKQRYEMITIEAE